MNSSLDSVISNETQQKKRQFFVFSVYIDELAFIQIRNTSFHIRTMTQCHLISYNRKLIMNFILVCLFFNKKHLRLKSKSFHSLKITFENIKLDYFNKFYGLYVINYLSWCYLKRRTLRIVKIISTYYFMLRTTFEMNFYLIKGTTILNFFKFLSYRIICLP